MAHTRTSGGAHSSLRGRSRDGSARLGIFRAVISASRLAAAGGRRGAAFEVAHSFKRSQNTRVQRFDSCEYACNGCERLLHSEPSGASAAQCAAVQRTAAHLLHSEQ